MLYITSTSFISWMIHPTTKCHSLCPRAPLQDTPIDLFCFSFLHRVGKLVSVKYVLVHITVMDFFPCTSLEGHTLVAYTEVKCSLEHNSQREGSLVVSNDL